MGPRRRRVVWTERAVASVDDAVAFVAADSPAAAERLLLRILESAESLSDFTERGRIVPEVDAPQVRELIIPPYRLVYEYDESKVQILTLLHTAQELRLRRPDRNAS